MYYNTVEISSFIGRIITDITKTDDAIKFEFANGGKYSMHHEQDCCENVSIEDICGDLTDLIGSPITLAEEINNDDDPEGWYPAQYTDSYTWTFYKLATVKGYVTIRWYGESNGYYSECVYIYDLRSPY